MGVSCGKGKAQNSERLLLPYLYSVKLFHRVASSSDIIGEGEKWLPFHFLHAMASLASPVSKALKGQVMQKAVQMPIRVAKIELDASLVGFHEGSFLGSVWGGPKGQGRPWTVCQQLVSLANLVISILPHPTSTAASHLAIHVEWDENLVPHLTWWPMQLPRFT